MAGELIMVVEDDEIIALEIASIVSQWGFETVMASSGEEALRVSEKKPPALALMDIKLKGPMDGIETAVELRERHGTAVVFVTAYSEKGIVDRAKLAMPFGFLVKPVQDQELRASIETALYLHGVEEDRRRAVEELRAAHDLLEQRVEERTGDLLRANKELAESEERYRALFENTRVGIGITTPEGEILETNPAITTILGYSPEEMRAFKTKDLYAKQEDRERIMAQLLDKGYLKDCETVYVHKNGSPIFVNINVTSVEWKNKKIFHTILEDITERKMALDAIIQAHAELEQRVEERTADLAAANALLRKEIEERKRAEESLTDSEARYRLLVESINEGIWYIDGDATTVFVNGHMAEMLGYTVEEMVGKHLFSFMDERGVALAKENIERRKQGISEQHEFEFIRKDGRRIYALLGTSPIMDDGGTFRGAIAGVIDITERKKAEEALRVSEARFRAVVENSYDGILFCDADSNVIYRSPSYTAINGFSDRERIGRNAFEMVHADHKEELLRKWKEVIEHPDLVFKMELQILHKNGGWLWVDSTAKNMLANPDVGAVVIVSRDINWRKKNELALRELNERLELTLNASDAGSWDWDVLSGTLAWSSKMFELFGIDESATEPTFDAWRAVVHPEDLEAAEARIYEALEEGKDLVNEYRVIRPDGEVRWINALGRGVYNAQGKPVRMSGICIDITIRRQMEELVRMSEEKFSRAFIASPAMVTIQSLDDGTFIDVNDAFLAITGFTREEIIGCTSLDAEMWVEADDRSRYIAELVRCGRTRNHETPCRMKSGEIRDCSISTEIIVINGRRCTLNFIMDITEQKRAAAILRQEHENFLTIFSMAPVGLLLIDTDLVINQVNTAAGAIVLRDPAEIIGRRAGGGIGCVHSHEEPRGCGYSTSCPACPLRRSIESVLAGGVPVTGREVQVLLQVNGSLQKRWLSINAEMVVIEGKKNVILAVGDITDLKVAEETTAIERELLRRCNRAESVRDLIRSLTLFLKNVVGSEAVGVRIRDGDDFPYYETKGFTEDFVLAENSLCVRDLDGQVRRDELGNPALECMCGNILCGRFDPSKPFFTPGGSFWSSCTTELLSTTTEEDRQARTRNRCNGEGYESVALVPIRVKDTVLGLFQFNDRRKDLYTAEKIAWLERLVDFVAISMAKLMADEDLRRQKEILQTISDNIPVMIAFMDNEGRFIWSNRHLEKILGWSSEEMKKKDIFAELFPDPELCDSVRTFIAQSNGGWREFKTRTRGGAAIFTEWANIILSDGGTIGIGQDITERKRVEDARLRLIGNLEALWGLSKTQDQDIHVITDYIFEQMKKLCGSDYAFYGLVNDDESEMTVYSWSRNAMKQCAMDDKPLVYRIDQCGIWAEAVRSRRAVVINDYGADFAGKHGLPEGHVPLCRLASVPVFRSGRIVAVGAVANKGSEYTDEDVKAIEEFLTNANIIIERKRAEYLLRLGEEQYHTVADFTSDWEFWIGPDGAPRYVSPSCERLTGYTQGEFMDDPGLLFAMVHPNDKAAVRAHFSADTHMVCEPEGFDFRIIRRDGAVRWIGHRCQAVHGKNGRFLGRRGSHRDITDRKNAEEEVLRLNRHIITLQEEERQRVAKDLHDGVSQMMNAAKLNFAAFGQDPEKNMERFDTAMEFIDLASRELREVYSNLYPAVLEDLGLAAAVRLYTKNFLANRGIEAEVTIDEDLQLSIQVQMDLYRIIQESCSNIARHSGATLSRISLKKENGGFQMEIFDNGGGFDPGAPRNAEGGFGIINMKQRVKHLGGSFLLETGNSGTRISITIPGGRGNG